MVHFANFHPKMRYFWAIFWVTLKTQYHPIPPNTQYQIPNTQYTQYPIPNTHNTTQYTQYQGTQYPIHTIPKTQYHTIHTIPRNTIHNTKNYDKMIFRNSNCLLWYCVFGIVCIVYCLLVLGIVCYGIVCIVWY